jgi:pimeloyl-ACP methyl ester carboxylesterase
MAAKTFVLVHGAWHGGWCWRRVADLLADKGHKVYAPTLTGLADRSHVMSDSIVLATHVADIVNLIKWERLADIVLVGHSYAGFVISAVAEQVPVASIVFLDAFVPESGQSLVEITAPATREAILAARQRGDTAVPPRPAAFFKVNEPDQAWVDAMCTPHPIATMLEGATLTGARERVPRKTYIRAQLYPNPAFDAACDRLKSDAGWRVLTVPCGHDVMIDMPERLTEILLDVA